MTKFILSISFLLLFSSCYNEETHYESISFEKYNSYKPYDTLVEKGNILITKWKDTTSEGVFQILLKKENTYFIFDSDCDLENDATIIAYAPPFKWDEKDHGMQKNGIWFYAEFYNGRNKAGNAIHETSESGVQFSVDSIPKEIKNLPTREGIYFFKKDSLILISHEQTENKFSTLNKTGFYFVPNSGRFFERIKIDSIK